MRRTPLNVLGALLVAAAAVIPAAADVNTTFADFTLTVTPEFDYSFCGKMITLPLDLSSTGIWNLCQNPPPNFVQITLSVHFTYQYVHPDGSPYLYVGYVNAGSGGWFHLDWLHP